MTKDDCVKYMKSALFMADKKAEYRMGHHGMPCKERLMDTALCSTFSQIMEEKLCFKRAQGRGGWWDENQCSIEYLRKLLREHIDKGDMVDVANFAAMIYARECMESNND